MPHRTVLLRRPQGSVRMSVQDVNLANSPTSHPPQLADNALGLARKINRRTTNAAGRDKLRRATGTDRCTQSPPSS